MIGLILIYFIGKQFYELAYEFNKNQWLFAILGVVAYYAGTFIGGIILGLIDYFSGSNFVSEDSGIAVKLLAVPFGLLACWGLYKALQVAWRKNKVNINTEILDDGDVFKS